MDMQEVVRAEELVVRSLNDDEQTYQLTYAQRLQHVVDTVDLDRVDGDDDLAEAYRVVLAYRVSPRRSELLDLVRVLASEGVLELTTAQRVWAWQAERGELR